MDLKNIHWKCQIKQHMKTSLKQSISWDTKNDKYSKTEIIPYILSDYYGTKLKMDNKENSTEFINSWRLEIRPLFTEWWLGQKVNQERNQNQIP